MDGYGGDLEVENYNDEFLHAIEVAKDREFSFKHAQPSHNHSLNVIQCATVDGVFSTPGA